MSEERLVRIEDKLDGMTTNLADLALTTADLTVGQASLEHRFESLGRTVELVNHRFARGERDWARIEEALQTIRDVGSLRHQVERGFSEVLDRLEHRVRPLEDESRQLRTRLDQHEQRIAALESGHREA